MSITERLSVVSLVPSWTETLLFCGANVVGRTRFCIHPKESVQSIPVLGGTKDLNRARLSELKPPPALLILDQDENPRAFTEGMALRWHATHIRAARDVAPALREMAAIFVAQSDRYKGESVVAERLVDLARRWEAVASAPNLLPKLPSDLQLARVTNDFPGLVDWLIPFDPEDKSGHVKSRSFVYLIWKDPWMACTEATFIGSVLAKTGWDLQSLWPKGSQAPYPAVDLKELPPNSVVLLSTEPFPFAAPKVRAAICEIFKNAEHAVALIDGESMSWFGIRTLLFLESALKESLK